MERPPCAYHAGVLRRCRLRAREQIRLHAVQIDVEAHAQVQEIRRPQPTQRPLRSRHVTLVASPTRNTSCNIRV